MAGSEMVGISLLDLLSEEIVLHRQSGDNGLWRKLHDSAVSKSDGAASVLSTLPESVESVSSDGEEDEGVEVDFLFEIDIEKMKRKEGDTRWKLRLGNKEKLQKMGRSLRSLRMLQRHRKSKSGQTKSTKLNIKATCLKASVSKAPHLIVLEKKRAEDQGKNEPKVQVLPVQSPSFWSKIKPASKRDASISSMNSNDMTEVPLKEEDLTNASTKQPKEATVCVQAPSPSESSVAESEDDDETGVEDLKLITTVLYNDQDTQKEEKEEDSSCTNVAETTWTSFVEKIDVMNSCGCHDDDDDKYIYKQEEIQILVENIDDDKDVFEGLSGPRLLRKVISVSFDNGKGMDDGVSSMSNKLSETSDESKSDESSNDDSSTATSYEEVTLSTFDDESITSDEYDDFKKAMMLLRNRAAK